MMKRNLIVAAVVFVSLASLGGWVYVFALCGDRWQPAGADTFGGSCGSWGNLTTITQTKHWRIFWLDGYERNDAQVTEQGQCKAGFFSDTRCYPTFHEPSWVNPSNNEA
ncbi:MAG TPA: hypothetical protein VK422_06375 [Pyrinomonadaceae bacterium]|nr:hypothetical protein [Pyrinomonadaceae bacterium]